jgi:hypothetical protein
MKLKKKKKKKPSPMMIKNVKEDGNTAGSPELL